MIAWHLPKDQWFRDNAAAMKWNIPKDQWFAENWYELNMLAKGAVIPLQVAMPSLYAEVGLTRGLVDPDYTHSLGEKGAFPMPGNADYWIGKAIPGAEGNIASFMRYLAALQVKEPYGPRFTEQMTQVQRACLLAAIVHGYLYAPNYRRCPRNADMGRIAAASCDCLTDGEVLLALLERFGYAHGRALLLGRLDNLRAGWELGQKLG